jgi:photosystem I subunit XI
MAEELVRPYQGDPFLGNLETPLNSSPFSKAFINNLPAYRKGLSPLLRGLEIGLAHGYFLVGPWAKLGPLRDSDAAYIGALMSAVAVVILGTVGLTLHGLASYQKPEAETDELHSAAGWSQFAGGFFIGGTSSAFVAYFLLENFSVVDSIFRGLVN